MSIVDGLIAATAGHLDLTLVTRNAADFDLNENRLFNPWMEEAI